MTGKISAVMIFCMLAVTLAAQGQSSASDATSQLVYTLNSPDGQLKARIGTARDGRLNYSLSCRGEIVAEPAELGVTVDGVDLGAGVALKEERRAKIDETYPVMGGHTVGRNRCNALTLQVTHAANRTAYELELRAFDDGFAWRYRIPGTSERLVNGEASSWVIPAGSTVWFFERPNAWKLKSYAGYYLKAPIENLEKASKDPVQGPPLVIELPQGRGYVALTEAALYNYGGLRLKASGGRKLTADFTEGKTGFKVAGEILTPWRVTLVSKDLNGLVNSDVITNLNPAPDPKLFADTSWIKPGRAVWSWLAEPLKSPENFELQKEYAVKAAQLGFEYTLVDEGWPKWPDPWKKLAELSAFARAKGVRVLVWVRSDEISKPEDNYRLLREYLDQVRAAGVAGLKIDFINSEAKAAVDFETAALTEAARRQLLIVFHGCQKPTGESRTFPNELSREAVRGIELNFMKEGPLTPDHDAALPFTRFIAGPGDYTPVIFRKERMGATTWGHQLAMSVALTSPLLVYAENPELMKTNPSFDVLKSIPAAWDETRVLPQSRIGELAALARRSGRTWFVALVNGTAAKKVTLPASFLGGGAWRAVILSDNPTQPDAFKREERSIKPGELLEIELNPGGGCLIRLAPAPGVGSTIKSY